VVVVFPNQVALDSAPPLPSGVAYGFPVVGADGRVAISHQFEAEDLEVLRNTPNAEVSEDMPSDWQYPPTEEV
jgi:hypothetical protein